MKTPILIILLISFILWGNDVDYQKIRFSEVGLWETERKSSFIELYNATDTSINLNNWTIKWSNEDSITLYSSNHLILEPSAVLLILPEENSIYTENDSTHLFHTNFAGANSLINSTSNALYLLDETGIKVDYIRWGNPTDTLYSLNSIDSSIAYIDSLFDSTIWVGPERKFFGSGSSISLHLNTREIFGRTFHQDFWNIMLSDEKTPGILDLYGTTSRPLLSTPRPLFSLQNVGDSVTLSCQKTFYAEAYQFGIYSDSLCTDLVDISEWISNRDFNCVLEFPENNQLYWRARVRYPTELISKWSSSRRIYNAYEGKEYNWPR